jgi:hypothetical protein
LPFVAIFYFADRPKRDAFANDPKGYLDAIIGHLIYSIPNKIDDAVSSGEASLRLARAKRVTQVRNFYFYLNVSGVSLKFCE